jgi:hypothetical protein
MGLFSFLKKKPAATAATPKTIICWIPPRLEIKMTNFTFTTREEYVTYSEDWKARYAAQILEIRQLKEAFKSSNRAFSLISKGERRWVTNCDDKVVATHTAMDKARYKFIKAKNAATQLLFERVGSKIEAGRQRELRLKKVA